MLKERYRLVTFGLFLLDSVTTLLAFGGAYLVRAGFLTRTVGRPLYPFEAYLPLLLVILPAWGLAFWFSGLYRSHRTISILRESREIVRGVAMGGLVLALFLFLSKTGPFISRLFIVIFLVLGILLLVGERAVVRVVGRAVRRRGRNFRNILVVGTDDRSKAFADSIREHPSWGIRVLGHLDPDGGAGRVVEESAVLGGIADLPRLISETVVDEVIFVVSPARMADLEDTFLLCEEQGVRTRVVLEYLPKQMARVYVEMVDGLPVMTFTTAPIEATALAVKRAADIVLAALLLVLTAPLLLVIALAVRLTSPGPVLFRQVRVGLSGRRFTLLKFRSMHAGAEERQAELAHLNVMDGPVFKVPRDPRVTPVGRFLRASSLDELPQLVNILRGDMSFVGPRPPVPEEVARYERWQRRRLSMKPGLTGLWQVSGRNEVDFATWMRMDLDYIDRWSLWLDLKILLKTIPTVLSRRGAM